MHFTRSSSWSKNAHSSQQGKQLLHPCKCMERKKQVVLLFTLCLCSVALLLKQPWFGRCRHGHMQWKFRTQPHFACGRGVFVFLGAAWFFFLKGSETREVIPENQIQIQIKLLCWRFLIIGNRVVKTSDDSFFLSGNCGYFMLSFL